MGYEHVETDSLITLKIALRSALIRLGNQKVYCQICKDITYELDRILSELNNR